MKAILHHISGRLHRKLFVGFGVTIFVTFLALGFVMHGLSAALPSPWEEDVDRVAHYFGGQFAEVWTRPAAREALALRLAEGLHIEVRLQALDGTSLGRFGPHCHWRSWTFDVPGQGRVEICVPHRKATGGARFAIGLAVVGTILWLGSGLLARRITRPLRHLADVADRLGAGRAQARAEVPGHDEIGHLAGAINDMAARIQAQLDDQRALLAGVSHELRTPLGHLRLLVELAGTEALPLEERRRALDEIDAEVKEMDDLVGELLASSRLDFGSLQLQLMLPMEVARRALARFGLSEDLLEIQGELPSVPVDATLVNRALSNLLRNAEVHAGGVVRLVLRPRAGGVAFEVEDSGPGIPEVDKERIFRPFHRGDRDRTGLGLGLALVTRIAEAHGGRAYAEDRGEGGARVGFTVRNPTGEEPGSAS